MAKTAKALSLDSLSPTQFENLIFDLMVLRGMSNVQWRTPGADGGRDIEGQTSVTDFSGYQRTENWYMECKRYKTSISWPIIYEKIAHADAASADVLLMCTQSTFSPAAITRVREWNQKHGSLKIRLWPKHDLELRLGEHPDLCVKYGLSAASDQPGGTVTQLSLTMFKALTSYCASQEMKGAMPDRMLEAARAISSLIHKKIEDIELSGRIRTSGLKTESEAFVDIQATPSSQLDLHGVRAYAHLLAALTLSRVKVESQDDSTCALEVEAGGKIEELIGRYGPTFSSICFWSNFDSKVSNNQVILTQREVLS